MLDKNVIVILTSRIFQTSNVICRMEMFTKNVYLNDRKKERRIKYYFVRLSLFFCEKIILNVTIATTKNTIGIFSQK